MKNSNKMKNIIDNIGFFLVIFNIFIFNIIVGSNDKAVPIFNIAILLFFSIIFLTIKKIVFKEKIIIKNKVDIAVLLFNISLLMPILFKTYSSFEDSINFFIKYQFVYANYLLVRNFVNSRKKFDIVIVSTIIFSLIVIIFGIDKQHSYIFKDLIEKLNLNYEKDERFSSTFGYVNAVTIYIAFCIFLSINRIENSKKVALRVFFVLYIILGFYVVYISLSRVVLLILLMTLGIYFLVKIYSRIKDNKKVIKKLGISIVILSLLGVGFIGWALNYSKPYSPNSNIFKFRKRFEPNTVYKLSFDIFVEDENKNNNLDEKNPEIEEKIDEAYKKYLTSSGISEDNKLSKKEFYNLNYERYYKEFGNNNLKLKIIEVNDYFSEKELAVIDITNKESVNNIEIETSDDVYYLKMKFENLNEQKITIKKCYINDEEYALAYKYLPRVIGRLISSFAYTDDSLVMRKQFYKTSIEIAKRHLIVGNGGNAWQNLQNAYQEYLYNAKETHSYFFELLISYGIIGVISFLVIIIALLKFVLKQMKLDKEKVVQKQMLLIGFCVLILHSLFFDFNMSFIIIMLIVFDYIGLLQIDLDEANFKKENSKILNIIEYVVIINFVIIFSILVRANIAKYLIKDTSLKAEVYGYNSNYVINDLKQKSKTEIVLKDLKKFMQKEPYYLQNMVYNLYWNQICSNIDKLSDKEIKEYMDFGIKQYKKAMIGEKMNFEFILTRANIMLDTIKKLEKNDNNREYIKEIKEIIKSDYDKNIVNIEDNQRNYLTEDKKKEIEEKYDSILNSIK